jgi:hypothetical protein
MSRKFPHFVVEAGKALLMEGRKVVVAAVAEEVVGVALSRNVPGSDLIKKDEVAGLMEGEGVDEGILAPDDVT